MQTKMNPPKMLAVESERTIEFLTRVSESLKQQRRHFDDAVVTHCIRLIHDYAEDDARKQPPDRGQMAAGTENRY